jgi:HopA1 effector protein family
MPLLNRQNQPSDTSQTSLNKVLEDIADHIRIQSNFCMSHPRHDALELLPEVFDSLQTLSVPLQDQYLRLRLGSYLYSIYDANGNLSRLNSGSENEPIQERMVLNTALGVHSSFFAALHDCNTGEGYLDPDWLVLRESSDGLLVAQKDGLTLHVSRERHLDPTDRSAAIGDRIAVRLPRNLIEDECYVAVGNAGPSHDSIAPSDSQPAPQEPALQEEELSIDVYFNLDAEGGLALMKDLTTVLNASDLPFKLKVPMDEADCDRPDAISLTFSKAHYSKIQPLLSTIYQEQQAQYRPEIPLFAKFLAPGLALAEHPRQTFTPHESFGLNRYQIVAEGLLTAWRQQNDDASARMSAIRQSFASRSIDLDCPYLNPGSKDLA